MKILSLLLLLSFSASFVSCSTTGSYIALKKLSPKNKNCDVEIFMPVQKIKRENSIIGNFSVREMGLSVGCGWEDTLAKNKAKACEVGADGIQFLEVDSPSIRSTCYQTKANFIIFTKK